MTRDVVAAVVFGGAFLASWIAEQACGTSWERCPALAWQPLSAADLPYTSDYHCVPVSPNGLGDPALSIGSLQFAAAVAYLELNSRLSALPVVAVFVGITSFLFHARNTVPHHRLDLTGVALLAPAVLDTAAARVLPLDEARRPGAIVGVRTLLFTVPVVIVAMIHPTVPSWDPLWSIAITYAVLAFAAYAYGLWKTWSNKGQRSANMTVVAGLLFFVVTVVLLIVGDNDVYWTCVSTQLGEPHYWGHFLGAAAVTLLSRSSSSAADATENPQL